MNNPRNEPEDLACAGSRGTVTISEADLRTLDTNYENAKDANIRFTQQVFNLQRKNRKLESSIEKAAKLIGELKRQIAAKSLQVSYDEYEDVLNIIFTNKPVVADNVDSTEIDIKVRSKEGKIVGLTFVDATFILETDRKKLAASFSQHQTEGEKCTTTK